MELDRQGVKALCSRQYDALIQAADMIIRECQREPISSSAGMGLKAWLASDDTGMSSKYMASVLSDVMLGKYGFSCEYAHPHDLDDFGRCSRLLLAVPEFRERINLMRDKSKEWSALLDIWTDIELLMNNKKHKEANKLVMNTISRFF